MGRLRRAGARDDENRSREGPRDGSPSARVATRGRPDDEPPPVAPRRPRCRRSSGRPSGQVGEGRDLIRRSLHDDADGDGCTAIPRSAGPGSRARPGRGQPLRRVSAWRPGRESTGAAAPAGVPKAAGSASVMDEMATWASSAAALSSSANVEPSGVPGIWSCSRASLALSAGGSCTPPRARRAPPPPDSGLRPAAAAAAPGSRPPSSGTTPRKYPSSRMRRWRWRRRGPRGDCPSLVHSRRRRLESTGQRVGVDVKSEDAAYDDWVVTLFNVASPNPVIPSSLGRRSTACGIVIALTVIGQRRDVRIHPKRTGRQQGRVRGAPRLEVAIG